MRLGAERCSGCDDQAARPGPVGRRIPQGDGGGHKPRRGAGKTFAVVGDRGDIVGGVEGVGDLAPERALYAQHRLPAVDRRICVRIDGGETVLRIQGAFRGQVPDTFNATNNVTAITYNREGFASTAAGFVTTTITLRDSTANGAWTRCLVIAPATPLSTQTHAINPGTC